MMFGRRGVGLPVRKDFYERIPGRTEEVVVSPYFTMRRSELKELVQNAIRRSDFRCYFLVSKVLAQSLQRIIEIPEDGEGEVRESIARIFEQFVDSASTLLPADYRHHVAC